MSGPMKGARRGGSKNPMPNQGIGTASFRAKAPAGRAKGSLPSERGFIASRSTAGAKVRKNANWMKRESAARAHGSKVKGYKPSADIRRGA